MQMTQPVHDLGTTFVNGLLSGGKLSNLTVVGSHIAAVDEAPRPGDIVVDLKGDRLYPGLINAHDHLQLNNLPHPPANRPYSHVRDWIAEVDARRHADPEFAARSAEAREARLAIGGIKNLLSGVTTVAHHDPLYIPLTSATYPTQVVQHYGWSHSLYLDGAGAVRESHRSTPAEWPWVIHAAEGINEEAAREFDTLDMLGCLGANTLLVHGIALDGRRRRRLIDSGAGLIWCPSSNLNLFGRTAQVSELMSERRVALGTDSRLSGARDLLQELQVAARCTDLDERSAQELVTRSAANLLRLPDRGELRPGARADLLVLPSARGLTSACRADVRLVVIGGAAHFGDVDYARLVSPASTWTTLRVDGRLKALDAGIAALLSSSRTQEPGLELLKPAWRAA